MTYLQHQRDQCGQRLRQNYGPISSPKRSTYTEKQSSSSLSDYISQPVFSSSDYISKPSRAHQKSYSSHDGYQSRRSQSDYISRPQESRHDCISNEVDPSVSPDAGSISSPQDPPPSLSATSFSSPVCHAMPPTRSSFSHAPKSCYTQSKRPKEKSNYQMIKEGGWGNRHDFIRSHGLKTQDLNADDDANNILDGYRKIDSQSSRSVKIAYHGQIGSAANGKNGANGMGSLRDSVNNHDEEMYGNDSDVSSYRSGPDSGRVSPSLSAAPSNNSTGQDSDHDNVYASDDESSASDMVWERSDSESNNGENILQGSGVPDDTDRSDIDSIGSSDVEYASEYASGDDGSDIGYGACDVEDGYVGYDKEDGEDDD